MCHPMPLNQSWNRVLLRIFDLRFAIFDLTGFFSRVYDDFETTRQCPKEFENRYIERRGGYCEPGAERSGPTTASASTRPARDTVVHRREEVDYVSVFDHNPFGFARGTRGVDYVGEG